MVYRGFYSLTTVPDRDKLSFYLENAREFMTDDPPSVALISYDPPSDFPIHIQDQMKAHMRDNPEGCYVIFV